MDRLSEIRARCERAQREDFPERVYGSAAYYCVYDDIPYLLSLLEETWEWDMYQCAKREIERLRGEVGRLQEKLQDQEYQLSLDAMEHSRDEAIARAEKAEAADRWIPVGERLPEDDNPVWAFGHIVHGARTAMFKGRWIAAHTMRSGDFGADDDMSLEYDEAEDEFYVPEGWFERIENWDDFTDIAAGDYIVTHWRPLPEPPKEART